MGPHAHPEITMHTPPLSAYVARLEAGDWPGVAELMRASAEKLANAGADLLICPDNTIHRAFDLVAPQSPRPWLHIAEVVAVEAKARGFRRLAITGTKWLVAGDVYPDKLAAHGLEWVRPSLDQCTEIDRIIMDELVAGIFRPESAAAINGIIADMKADGCDAVILGCTELPLITGDDTSPLPTLDSTRLLARAALTAALA